MTVIEVTSPPLVDPASLAVELDAAGFPDLTVALTTADVGAVRVEGDDLTDADREAVAAVVAAHVPPSTANDGDLVSRLAAVEGELRGMRERAAAATSVTGGAATIRDAITGPAG